MPHVFPIVWVLPKSAFASGVLESYKKRRKLNKMCTDGRMNENKKTEQKQRKIHEINYRSTIQNELLNREFDDSQLWISTRKILKNQSLKKIKCVDFFSLTRG